jgi:hypothetical protein
LGDDKIHLLGIRRDNNLLGVYQIFEKNYFLKCFDGYNYQHFDNYGCDNKYMIQYQFDYIIKNSIQHHP